MSVYVNFRKGSRTSEALANYTVAKIQNAIKLTNVDAVINFSRKHNSYEMHCSLTIDGKSIFEVSNLSIDFFSALALTVEQLERFFYENGNLYRNFQKQANTEVEPVTFLFDESHKSSIDADDLIKYEYARQKVS